MTNLSKSNNDLLKKIGQNINADINLSSTLGADKAEQAKQLKEIFTTISDNNISSAEKSALEATAKKLDAKIAELNAQMTALENEIKKKEEAINEKAEEIASLMVAINDKSSEVEKKQHDIVKNIISDVFKSYENGNIKKDTISAEINKRVKSSTYKIKGQLEIKGLIGKLSNNEAEVKRMSNEAGDWIDRKNHLQKEFGVTQSAYSLLNKTIKQIGNTSTTYTNSDINSKQPVYSLTKLDYASDLYDKYGVSATNTAKITGSKPGDFKPNIEQVGTKESIVDGSRVTKEEERNGKKYKVTYEKVQTDILAKEYPTDTYSNAGNTIDSNEQLKSFSENYPKILDDLKNNGFSYKEAMFLLFNEENGLYKDCGITYNLDEQTGGKTLDIAKAGNNATETMYSQFAAKLKSVYGQDIQINNQNNSISTVVASSNITTKEISAKEIITGPPDPTPTVPVSPDIEQPIKDVNDLMDKLGISKEEQDLAKTNKLKLDEKLANGSPRYIFAMGCKDNKYHIYDMAQRGSTGGTGTSLARLYGNKNKSPRGSDIVPNGNGYIHGFSTHASFGNYQYYYYTDNTAKSSKATYTTCSPLVFDLTGEGINVNTNKIVEDDIDADGIIDKHFDIGANNAVLVWDPDKNGTSGENGSEYFGDNTVIDGVTYENGFEALKALAKKEGLINGEDDNELNADDLKLLEENYGLKLKVGSYTAEATSLADVGITSIKLANTKDTQLNETYQNTVDNLMTQQGATFTINGQEREYADLWHKKLDDEAISYMQDKPKIDKNEYVDPISFRQGDVEYAFLIDRADKDGNTDGKITDMSEYVGAGNQSWLEDLKSLDKDGDGILNKEELKNLRLIGTKYTDGKAEDGESSTTVEYIMTNAADMGISPINLKELEEQVNNPTGEQDLNGAKLFNDGIELTIKGKPVTAKRKDSTPNFMNAVYGNTKDKRISIGLTDSDVEQAMQNDGYKKMDEFNKNHAETFNNVNLLGNFDNLVKEANQLYTMSDERMSKDESIQKIQAANKAAALKDSSSWSSIYSEVMRIASDEGIAIDMEQAKGIFMREKGQTARQVVDTYKKQTKMKEDIDKERNQSKIAIDALIKCSKNGIKQATIAEIKNLLSSGKAISAQDVVDILKEKYNVK